MQKNAITSFVDLILFDQSLLDYENQLDLLYDQIAVIEQTQRAYSNDLVRKQNELVEIKKYISTCEDDLNEAIAEEKKMNDAHKEVHDKREYAALKKELDHCHGVQQSLEKRLLQAFAQVEQMEKECCVLQEKVVTEGQNVEHLLQECRTKIQETENAFESAKTKRISLQDQVPSEWIAQYERIRSDIPDPLAFVVEESCSRCFEILTPYELIKIAQAPLMCKGCFRFLCMQPH